MLNLIAGVGSSLHRKSVFDSCTVSREGAVNLSCDVTLPAHNLRMCTVFLFVCLSTRTPIHRSMQARALHQRETLFGEILGLAVVEE